jgi:NAD(P)-dependent dehydrogenase (short-subunit alcohol dehydrogenase family)
MVIIMELPFKIDLNNKVAVITGAGGVLCSEFALAIAKCGASVAVLDLNYDSAKAVADRIVSDGGKALPYKANVLERKSLEEAREKIEKELGICDILINGAGGNNPRGSTDDEEFSKDAENARTFFDIDPEGFRFVFDLNLMGTLLTTQVFALNMVGRLGATIVNISSMNAFRPLTKIPAYSGAKAAVSNFTQWLAVYFAKSGIRVNALAPGFFVTKQNKDLLFSIDGSPTARTDKILRNTPMGRFGEANELIGTLLWLISPVASGFVTGIVVPVDGGFSAYSGV